MDIMCAVVSPMKTFYRREMEVKIRKIEVGQKREKFYPWHERLEAHTSYYTFANIGMNIYVRELFDVICR